MPAVQEILEPQPLVVPTIKWTAYQGPTGGGSVVTFNIGDSAATGGALGTFATGDLYIVMVSVGIASGGIGSLTISGTGWTQIIYTQSSDTNMLTAVWWKKVGSGETGVYAINYSPECNLHTWNAWNLGQSAYVDAWASTNNFGPVNNCRIPGCSPTSSTSLLITNWFMYDQNATPSALTLPGGVTTLFNAAQGSAGQGASVYSTANTAGTAADLTATSTTSLNPNSGYTGFQIAIASASPPSGGGGTSPIKWIGYQSTVSDNTNTSVLIGQPVSQTAGAAGQAIGTFATGDLYVVAAVINTQGGSLQDPGAMSISGSGWTNLVATAAAPHSGLNINSRFAVWARTASSGDTGQYTVSWTNPAVVAWVAWNYGQATIDVAAGSNVSLTSGTNCVAPSVTTTQANDLILAFWATYSPSFVSTMPTALTMRANDQNLSSQWCIGTGDTTQATAGATGNMTAVASATNINYASFQLAMKVSTAPPPSGSLFPLFTPIIPPPLIGVGGGPPPTFPPPTPPPIGAIPPGVLVGPAIAAAGVPPSTAGIPLIRFTFGSATTPPASAAFPEFTTTFPSPPIVFSNIFTDGVSPTTPPSTTTTQCITISGNMGPPIGPALPPVVPVSRPFMVATNGNPDEEIHEAPMTANDNGAVYDDSDEEEADWVEDTPRPAPQPSKSKRGRPRRK